MNTYGLARLLEAANRPCSCERNGGYDEAGFSCHEYWPLDRFWLPDEAPLKRTQRESNRRSKDRRDELAFAAMDREDLHDRASAEAIRRDVKGEKSVGKTVGNMGVSPDANDRSPIYGTPQSPNGLRDDERGAA